VTDLLRAIRNYDQIVRLSPPHLAKVRAHDRRVPDPWLPDTLKRFYNHRCQICTHDFEPRYGVPFADTRQIKRTAGRRPVSEDLVVVCPNHNAIIGATEARFDRRSLAFEYPNGLTERLVLREHLLVP
jgi:predicted restriction endonuclease